MRTKTVELNPDQVKVIYLDDKGGVVTNACFTHLFRVELKAIDIDPTMVVRVKYPDLDCALGDKKKCAKVKVTYLQPTGKELKYMSKLKNWISPTQEIHNEEKPPTAKAQ